MNKKNFDKELYTKESILQAIKDYSNICTITLIEYEKCFQCTFEKCIYNGNETVQEFGNYIIDLMNCGTQ